MAAPPPMAATQQLPMDKLPLELMSSIASFCVYPRDLAAWSQTCRRYHSIVGYMLYEISASSFWKYFSIVFWAARRGRTGTLRRLASIPTDDGTRRVNFNFCWHDTENTRVSKRNPQYSPSSSITFGEADATIETYLYHAQRFTPLHMAAYCGHADTVRFLLDNEADINATTSAELHVWRNYPMPHAESIFSNLHPIENSALYLAILLKHTDVVEILLDRGADIRVKPRDTRLTNATALHLAAQRGMVSIVRKIAERPEVDVNETDKNGFPPIIWAADEETSGYSCLETMKEIGADLEIVIAGQYGQCDMPLLTFLLSRHNFKAAAKLIEMGASIEVGEGCCPLHEEVAKLRIYQHNYYWNEVIWRLQGHGGPVQIPLTFRAKWRFKAWLREFRYTFNLP